MRNLGSLVLTAAVAAGVAACDDNPAGPSQQLEGTWRATRAQFASIGNPGLVVDVVSLGVTVILVLDPNHNFTLTATQPGGGIAALGGTWSATGDVLTLSWTAPGPPGQAQFAMSLSGETLMLDNGRVPYDLDGDGVNDDTILSLTLTRV